jgi:hypothetical protein
VLSSAVTNTQWVGDSTICRTCIITFCLYDDHQLPVSNGAIHI